MEIHFHLGLEEYVGRGWWMTAATANNGGQRQWTTSVCRYLYLHILPLVLKYRDTNNDRPICARVTDDRE